MRNGINSLKVIRGRRMTFRGKEIGSWKEMKNEEMINLLSNLLVTKAITHLTDFKISFPDLVRINRTSVLLVIIGQFGEAMSDWSAQVPR